MAGSCEHLKLLEAPITLHSTGWKSSRYARVLTCEVHEMQSGQNRPHVTYGSGPAYVAQSTGRASRQPGSLADWRRCDALPGYFAGVALTA